MSLYNSSNNNWKGDYLGFTIGEVHSSDLGITRISDSDRYGENLTPTYTDITTTVPGLDETYYFGTNFTQKTFTIKFAFDCLTDLQIRELRRIFSKKELQDLIFDETPYKVYSVKCNGQPTLSYICFDESFEENGKVSTRRIYKGDGTVTFIAYFPFARSRFKDLRDYKDLDENEKERLTIESGIQDLSTFRIDGYQIDVPIEIAQGVYSIQLYNPGDLPVYSDIYIGLLGTSYEGYISLTEKTEQGYVEKNFLTYDLASITQNERPAGLFFDTKKNLIFGLEAVPGKAFNLSKRETWKINSNKIYNQYITGGNFFNIPVINEGDSVALESSSEPRNFLVDYNYIYY